MIKCSTEEYAAILGPTHPSGCSRVISPGWILLLAGITIVRVGVSICVWLDWWIGFGVYGVKAFVCYLSETVIVVVACASSCHRALINLDTCTFRRSLCCSGSRGCSLGGPSFYCARLCASFKQKRK